MGHVPIFDPVTHWGKWYSHWSALSHMPVLKLMTVARRSGTPIGQAWVTRLPRGLGQDQPPLSSVD